MFKTALLAILLFTTFAYAHDFSDCGSKTLPPKSVTLVPDPPMAGRNLAIDVTGTATGNFTSGSAKVQLRYSPMASASRVAGNLGFTVYSTTLDACSLMKCPVNNGDVFNLTYSHNLPREALSGKYTADLTLTDSNGTTASCVSLTTDLVRTSRRLDDDSDDNDDKPRKRRRRC